MTEFNLALDWTPNINHIGFIVGKEKGFYENYNINLNIQSPADDNYKNSPAKKIELGLAHFGLCPTESVISFLFPFIIPGIFLNCLLTSITTEPPALPTACIPIDPNK